MGALQRRFYSLAVSVHLSEEGEMEMKKRFKGKMKEKREALCK